MGSFIVNELGGVVHVAAELAHELISRGEAREATPDERAAAALEHGVADEHETPVPAPVVGDPSTLRTENDPAFAKTPEPAPAPDATPAAPAAEAAPGETTVSV